MEDNNYGATGALFVAKTRKSEKSPDYNGLLEFDMEVVDDLIAQKQEGISQPKVNLVGWKKVSKTGNAYLRIIANVEKERQEANENGSQGYQKPREEPNSSNNTLNDEIPF